MKTLGIAVLLTFSGAVYAAKMAAVFAQTAAHEAVNPVDITNFNAFVNTVAALAVVIIGFLVKMGISNVLNQLKEQQKQIIALAREQAYLREDFAHLCGALNHPIKRRPAEGTIE